jgi:polyprenyl P-hydroxybenzoate/phenylacrylic acid decarboxylase-like protein
MTGEKKRLVIGVSGASGAVLAVHLLKTLQGIPDWETHLVISRGGMLTIGAETDFRVEDVAALAGKVYKNDEIGAAIASGSFKTEGMIIIPCSMKTAAGIHSGYAENLLLRAADVTLKEKRSLVLLARESPLSALHLKNLYELAMAGVSVIPPMMTFYNRPEGIADMVHHIVCKSLIPFGIDVPGYKRWQGLA